jgi:Domain of Unknown Function (DUF1080)
MRAIICVYLLAGFVLASTQPGTNPSNTLTPKEAAEGWLLLFDGETSFGWTAPAPDKLTVKEGTLRFDAADTLQTTTAFHEFALEFQCRIIGAQNHDDVRLGFAGTTVKMAVPRDKNSPWRRAKLLVASKRYKFTMAGPPGDFPTADGTLPKPGAAPIAFTVASGVQLELRDVVLLPLGHRPLFNGKNLEGWKEFAGPKYPSKFSVNDKLELNVKNGPGDLQTEAAFGDFLLQLDCISNGQHLNSGIFFRCRPNEYQNGYEAQIHNKFMAEPKAYVVEVLDPVSHKMLDKKKVPSRAADWGTGGIYRRVPARKEVAKDGEWFTMTIAAHGNHFATWVNGVQVVDWDDNRPPDTNPRNGFRLEPGHISIQGHDKTTDLSFRNLRISEYPAAGKK